MRRDFYTTAHRAEGLIDALSSHIERGRWVWVAQRGIRHPMFGGQRSVDTRPPAVDPGERAVFVGQHGERFELRNRWGFAVEVRLWPEDVLSRKKAFVASTMVHLAASVARPGSSCMETPGPYELSDRPQRHERAAFEAVVGCNRALTRALRSEGFRRDARTYSRPRIERSAHQPDDDGAEEVFVWSDSSWTLHTPDVAVVAAAVAGLMECRRATTQLEIPPSSRFDP